MELDGKEKCPSNRLQIQIRPLARPANTSRLAQGSNESCAHLFVMLSLKYSCFMLVREAKHKKK